MTKPRRRPQFPKPDGPAVITREHVRDRVISPIAGAPRAWRKLSPHERAYAKNQLVGGSPRFTASQRFEAGQNYAQIFLASQTAGRDSTQALNGSRSSGNGACVAQSQLNALDTLRDLESFMGVRDARIIEMVCGEGQEPAMAIKQVCGDYEKTVAARYREALDSLIVAFDKRRPLTKNTVKAA